MFGVVIGSGLFILGAVIGSFLNVVIHRHNTGKSLAGRSGCEVCGEQLGVFELIPIFSYLFQRGRCVKCKSKISPQYIIVETITGILFTLTGLLAYWQVVSPMQALVLFAINIVLVILAVYDNKHKILPDKYVFLFIILSAFYSLLSIHSISDLEMLVLGPLVTTLPIFLIWFLSRGRAMGFGDVKLSVGIGLLLGWYMGITALWYAFIIGAVVGLVLIAFKSAGWKSEIPFGPFLILGTLLVLFTQTGFIEILSAIMR